MRLARVCAVGCALAACHHAAPAQPDAADEPADATASTPDATDPTASENVELKADLDDPAAVLAALGLDDAHADTVQSVWFYDTHDLALYNAGAIARARKVQNASDDSTIKQRPMDVTQVSPAWLALAGAKCEVDRSPAHAVSACSLTATVAQGAIDDVAAGASIANVYTADQLVFLGTAGPVDLATLERLGPIASTVWKLTPSDLPVPLSLERWVLRDGSAILEASMRVPHAEADADAQAMLAWLAARGIALAADQESKTRAALASYTQ